MSTSPSTAPEDSEALAGQRPGARKSFGCELVLGLARTVPDTTGGLMDALRVKKCLVERGNFSDSQAEDIVEAFTEKEEGFVTVQRLRAELRKTELRIIGTVVAVNALFLAAAQWL